jgi:CRP/FNR family cyclic AMP-dependent transcriptional regulator
MGPSTVFWQQIGEPERAALAGAGRRARFRPGTALVSQGDHSSHAIVLFEGLVRVVAAGADGRSRILGLRVPGDLLGEQAGIDGGVRASTLIAVEAASGLVLTWSGFARIMEAYPAVSRAVLRTVSLRLREAEQLRLAVEGRFVTSRVAAAILDLTARVGRGGPRGLELTGVSQEDLASIVGSSRESVNRALLRLRRTGAVDTGRCRLTVTDPAALQAACE